MLYRVLADLVLVVHAAFVGFVVLGLVLILVGATLRWGWVRNLWFRVLHLTAIVGVVIQSWFGLVCPLTTLENRLRWEAGDRTYTAGFIADWLHRLLFYEFEPWVFTIVYSVFGVCVLAAFIFAPPRRRRGRSIRTSRF
ncbi:MAG: DUF2784 domain-containing protein [Planctomycetes bacterium]|nr:DUF2784 domain-containing protein [Planctomycetota bacterium]